MTKEQALKVLIGAENPRSPGFTPRAALDALDKAGAFAAPWPPFATTRARAGAALEAGLIRARRNEIPDTRLIEILLDALERAGGFAT